MLKKPELKQLIDDSGLRRSFIAEQIGVKHATINQWLCGSARPSREKIERLAAVLGVPLERIWADAPGDIHSAS